MKKQHLLSALFAGVILLAGTSSKATHNNTETPVKVYPTPSYECLVIESNSHGQLTILDENGMVTYQANVYKGSNQLKLTGMTAQRYFLLVKTDTESYVKRLLVK